MTLNALRRTLEAETPLAQAIAKSHVAAIIDRHGGIRTVVTEDIAIFKDHTGPGERCFIVPDFLVPEPVPWNMIPFVVGEARRYAEWWIRTRNDPDDLTGCLAAYVKRTKEDAETLARGESYGARHYEEDMRE